MSANNKGVDTYDEGKGDANKSMTKGREVLQTRRQVEIGSDLRGFIGPVVRTTSIGSTAIKRSQGGCCIE